MGGPCPPSQSLEAPRPTGSSLCLSLSNTVPTALQGKKDILHACFKSVFFLPPDSDLVEAERALYTKVCAGGGTGTPGPSGPLAPPC